MKILITSDTHGYYERISDLIIDQGDFDLMIHAGDGVEDCKNIKYETGIDYYVVKGNNDFFLMSHIIRFLKWPAIRYF